jgi:D-alanyl-lipoteichoic acid acyltransferase DltB (MBOAT superfamily)
VLFNSFVFIACFLPVVLAGFLFLARGNHYRLTAAWLTAASLFFYGWWNPRYVPLLLASIVFNYVLGGMLARKPRKALLIFGVAANVVLLGYFKYTGFLVGTADDIFGLGWTAPDILLPLAISFFTFQQIAYLSDAYDGVAVEHDLLSYSLFITFFPHLIAGPITHHKEMLPQFRDPDTFRPRWNHISVGGTLFLIGLFKKVMIADVFGTYARPIFDGAASGTAMSFFEAWTGALAYTLQIYFDFSGYTDMAIGIGLLFGISLPPNFNSPYKARSIIEFWSRWHMTLTRFLTAYIYNPLVLRMTRTRMRRGLPLPRRGQMTLGTFLFLVAFPTITTMFISGVWHGAGWQFIMFGLVHGVCLGINQGWRQWKKSRGLPATSDNPLIIATSVGTTFLCVIVGLVFFRAADVPTAFHLLASMTGLNGFALPTGFEKIPGVEFLASLLGLSFVPQYKFDPRMTAAIVLVLIAVWTLPNSQQWLRNYRTALEAQRPLNWIQKFMPAAIWRPSPAMGFIAGWFCFFTLLRAMSAAPTEFLYFQF